MALVKNPGVTPNRRTHIKFDVPEYSQLEPAFQIRRDREQIAAGGASFVDKCVVRGVGWQLDSYQDNMGRGRQSEPAQLGIYGTVLMAVAPKHVETVTWKKQPGVTYGSGTAATGDPYFQKQLASGDDPEQRLSADQTAFPGPTEGLGTSAGMVPDPGHAFVLSPMDRVAVTVEYDNPATTKVWRLKVIHNVQLGGTEPWIFAFHFGGPAGSKRHFVGFGQYCLMFAGDGSAILLERGERYDPDTTDKTTGWNIVRKLRLASSGLVSGRIYTIDVQTFVAARYPGMPFGGVFIHCHGGAATERNVPPGGSIMSAASPHAGAVTAASAGGVSVMVHIRREEPGYTTTEVVGTVKSTQARIDLPRDSRAAFQLSRLRYYPEGSITDDPFELPFFPVYDNDITVEFWGEQPDGTSITVKLYDSTTDPPTELTASSTSDWSAVFPSVVNSRYYHVKFTLTSDTGEMTPTLVGYTARRNGTRRLIEPDVFEADNLSSSTGPTLTRSVGANIDIHGAEADPSVASASFTVHDVTEILPKLKVRGELKTQIETEYDSSDPSKRSVLMRCYVQEPQGVRKGRGASGYGSKLSSYSLNAVGMWQRLAEALSTVRYNWNDTDPLTVGTGAERPWKVTDAVRTMLGWEFPSSMIDVPDLPLRFWSNPANDTFIEPLANIGDIVLNYVRQWLGMRLVFDENAGPYGMWRVRYANRAPYNNVCHFVTDSASAGSGKLQMMLGAYGVDGTDGKPIIPVQAGTLTRWKRRLEFNKLVVTTTGLIAGDDGTRGKAVQVFYNYKSYNFADLPDGDPNLPDPSHPDYCTRVIPAYIVDPTIGGSNSGDPLYNVVNWVGRRAMAIAGNTKTGLKFRAALPLVTETDDALSVTPRIPLYYDGCTVDGEQFLIRTCNPRYTKDKVQMADWELEAPREDFY